jgi:hypothetical protein
VGRKWEERVGLEGIDILNHDEKKEKKRKEKKRKEKKRKEKKKREEKKIEFLLKGVWYLNAFWLEGAEKEAETLWDFVERCGKIDNAKLDGNGLDEMEAHRFLEQIHDTHTVLEMRSKLRSTGAIGMLLFLIE